MGIIIQTNSMHVERYYKTEELWKNHTEPGQNDKSLSIYIERSVYLQLTEVYLLQCL